MSNVLPRFFGPQCTSLGISRGQFFLVVVNAGVPVVLKFLIFLKFQNCPEILVMAVHNIRMPAFITAVSY